MNPLAPAAVVGTFLGALAYLAGATLPHAIALGVMSTVAVVGLLGLARTGAARTEAGQAQPRKLMIAAGTIRPKRRHKTYVWKAGPLRYQTAEHDSGHPVRTKEAA